MKRVKSIIIYSIVFVGLLLFFAPKLQLYFALEKQMQSLNIKISQERVNDQGLTLALQEGSLYYSDLLVGQFETVSLLPALVFNRVNIERFAFSEEMNRFAKGAIHNVNVTHHIFMPLIVHISADADMGEMRAEINLKDRNVSLNFMPTEAFLKQPPFWLSKMKKSEEGGYAFETTY
jgi:hypothetical protein